MLSLPVKMIRLSSWYIIVTYSRPRFYTNWECIAGDPLGFPKVGHSGVQKSLGTPLSA
jgi:hypothetical protein